MAKLEIFSEPRKLILVVGAFRMNKYNTELFYNGVQIPLEITDIKDNRGQIITSSEFKKGAPIYLNKLELMAK